LLQNGPPSSLPTKWYAGLSPLKNPGKDAALVSEALQKVGFKTQIKRDVARNELWNAISELPPSPVTEPMSC
jgi:hypothetical protein